jgi:hypothetical protein
MKEKNWVLKAEKKEQRPPPPPQTIMLVENSTKFNQCVL